MKFLSIHVYTSHWLVLKWQILKDVECKGLSLGPSLCKQPWQLVCLQFGFRLQDSYHITTTLPHHFTTSLSPFPHTPHPPCNVTTSPCHPLTSSPCHHITTSPHYHIHQSTINLVMSTITSSPFHYITLPHHIIILSHKLTYIKNNARAIRMYTNVTYLSKCHIQQPHTNHQRRLCRF